MPPQRMQVTLAESTPLTDEVKLFRFTAPQPLAFTPGQYVSLRFPGELRYHAFSLASSPARKDAFELVIKRERDFTTRLFAAPPGTQLECLGPMGRFMEELVGDIVMIAGGVGVTPFLGMVRWARDAKLQDREYWLFYSCKTRADVFHEEELRAMATQNPHVHVVLVLTRETPQGWQGELGHVDRAMLERHLGALEGKTFYTCGPGRLIDGMKAMLAEAGVPKERVLTESWG